MHSLTLFAMFDLILESRVHRIMQGDQEVFLGINQAHLKSENENPTEMFSRVGIYANQHRTLMYRGRLSGKLNLCFAKRKPLESVFSSLNLVS